MTIIQAVILGFVQGITEFLPISSSGHLILIPYIFNWEIQNLEFDVALHLGTACAVILFFWYEWKIMMSSFFLDLKIPKNFFNYHNLRRDTKILLVIIVVSIPVGLIGFLLEDTIENVFRSPLWVSLMMILLSIFMYIADSYHKSIKKSMIKTEIDQIKFLDSLIISLSQIIALIPGSSRSGSTISFGLFRNLSRENAAKYSFLLGTPIILGAGLAQIDDLMRLTISDLPIYLAGFLASFITGMIVIKWLLKYLKTKDLTLFIVYRIILGIVILFMFVGN